MPENIILNNELNEKCQEAALMMHANSSLNHYPPIEWSCYSEDGYDAASHSNLAMGTHSSSSITAYIRDNGSGNYAVGHRRWILYSRASEFGTGSTSNYNALYVIASTVNAPENLSFISYPSPSFFPSPKYLIDGPSLFQMLTSVMPILKCRKKTELIPFIRGISKWLRR